MRAAEKIKGERWDRWVERHGDWSRDALMYLGTRQGGLWLAEVAPEAGVKYQAAAQAVTRFGQALAGNAERKRLASVLRRNLSTL